MTIQLPPKRVSKRPGYGTLSSFTQLPTRRPPEPPLQPARVDWTLIDIDRYEVRVFATTVGFVDVIGAVFVVLAGRRYDRAVEVAQTLVFEDAIAALGAESTEATAG